MSKSSRKSSRLTAYLMIGMLIGITISLLVFVLAGCKSVPQSAPPPLRPRLVVQTPQVIVTPPQTNFVGVTFYAQWSSNLVDWETFASMTTTQAGGFFRSYLSISPYPMSSPVGVLTYHNDNTRSGANTNESILGPGNVNTNHFGRLWTVPVSGHVYAQPLIAPGLGGRNTLVVATEHDMVYGIDADNGQIVWAVSVGTPAPQGFHGDIGIDDSVGVTGTPVIDAGKIYVDAFTVVNFTRSHQLHVLSITNGAEVAGSPVEIVASVTGTGDGAINGVVRFDPNQQLQRPALTLSGGAVYIAFGSYADANPYHGWIIPVATDTLQILTNRVYCTTPNGGMGAVWMSGNGPAADELGNLYFETGNGTFDPSRGSYSDSVVKISGGTALDYFAPSNQTMLNDTDNDLGSGGCLLVSNLVVGAGKWGLVHVLDRGAMGGYDTNQDHALNEWKFNVGPSAWGIWGSPVYSRGRLYIQGCYDVLRAWSLDGTLLATATNSYCAYPGMTPSLSSFGRDQEILWALRDDDYYLPVTPGAGVQNTNAVATLHAFDASTLAELWNSDKVPADKLGAPTKFAPPTVANGKVYVAGQNWVSAFGLKGQP